MRVVGEMRADLRGAGLSTSGSKSQLARRVKKARTDGKLAAPPLPLALMATGPDLSNLPDAVWFILLHRIWQGGGLRAVRVFMFRSKQLYRVCLSPGSVWWRTWVGPTQLYPRSSVTSFDRALLSRPQFSNLDSIVINLEPSGRGRMARRRMAGLSRLHSLRPKALTHDLALRGVTDTKAAIAALPLDARRGLPLVEKLSAVCDAEATRTRVPLHELILAKAVTLRSLWLSGNSTTDVDNPWDSIIHSDSEEDPGDAGEEGAAEEEAPCLRTEDLGAVLAGCTNLTELVISNMGRKLDFPAAFRSLPAAAPLLSVQFGPGVEITSELLETVADRCPSLRHVRLHYITRDTPLWIMFRKCARLETFRAHNMWLDLGLLGSLAEADDAPLADTDHGMAHLFGTTPEGFVASSLRELGLPRGYGFGDREAFSLLAATFPNLESLDLSEVVNGPTARDILSVAQTSLWSDSMRELRLPVFDSTRMPSLVAFGREELTDLLVALPNLRKLWLWLSDGELIVPPMFTRGGVWAEPGHGGWQTRTGGADRTLSSLKILEPTELASAFSDAGWEESKTQQMVMHVRCGAERGDELPVASHRHWNERQLPLPRGCQSRQDSSWRPLAEMDQRYHTPEAQEAIVPRVCCYQDGGRSLGTPMQLRGSRCVIRLFTHGFGEKTAVGGTRISSGRIPKRANTHQFESVERPREAHGRARDARDVFSAQGHCHLAADSPGMASLFPAPHARHGAAVAQAIAELEREAERR